MLKSFVPNIVKSKVVGIAFLQLLQFRVAFESLWLLRLFSSSLSLFCATFCLLVLVVNVSHSVLARPVVEESLPIFDPVPGRVFGWCLVRGPVRLRRDAERRFLDVGDDRLSTPTMRGEIWLVLDGSGQLSIL